MSFRVKTKVQQRALVGERYRGVFETLTRLIRGKFIIPELRSWRNADLAYFLCQVLTHKTQSRY